MPWKPAEAAALIPIRPLSRFHGEMNLVKA